MYKSIETGIGTCGGEMKGIYHNWDETVVDKNGISSTALKEREQVNEHIDHDAKTAPNNWLKCGKKYKITITQGCPEDNPDWVIKIPIPCISEAKEHFS